MPWLIRKRDDQWCVYREVNGEPEGDTLGCHDTEAAAQAQLAALYANEPEAAKSAGPGPEPGAVKAITKSEQDGDHPASHYLVVEDPERPTTWHLRVRDVGGSLDHGLMGAAWAALHEGYRGNRYEGPNKQDALTKLRNCMNKTTCRCPQRRP